MSHIARTHTVQRYWLIYPTTITAWQSTTRLHEKLNTQRPFPSLNLIYPGRNLEDRGPEGYADEHQAVHHWHIEQYKEVEWYIKHLVEQHVDEGFFEQQAARRMEAVVQLPLSQQMCHGAETLEQQLASRLNKLSIICFFSNINSFHLMEHCAKFGC